MAEGQQIRIFQERPVDDEAQTRKRNVEAECRRLTNEEILEEEVEVLAERIAQRFYLDVPSFLFDQAYAEEPELTSENSFAIVRLHIPVKGDGSLLRCYSMYSPVTGDFQSRQMSISEGVFSLRIVTQKSRIVEDTTKYKQEIVDLSERYLGGIAHIVKHHLNPQLLKAAKDVLERRRSELKANETAREAFASLGLPIKKRTDEVAQAFVPEKRRELELPEEKSVRPFLVQQAYEEILKTIRSMAHGIERSPATFQGMKEPDIRMVLLIGLNAVYEGQATGETFNGKGKTDILIRVGDINIFIAECLVWGGEEDLVKKLHQLLGYVNWRDSKTALVVFNKNKNLTAVVATMRATLESQPQCVRKLDYDDETGARFLFRRLDDPDKLFQLTCLVFDVPA
jgi:hypothetical protein